MSLCSPVMLKGLTKGRREKDVGLWSGKDDRRRELRETSEKREREREETGNYTQLRYHTPIPRLLQATRSSSTSNRILTEENAHQ